jgi:hypothetical protein
MEDHSDEELRDYKAFVADWEKTREMGMARFILVYGVLMYGVPTTIVVAIILHLTTIGLKFDLKIYLHPATHIFFVLSPLIIGIRVTLDDWKTNEAEYQSWKLYESGGDILGIDD